MHNCTEKSRRRTKARRSYKKCTVFGIKMDGAQTKRRPRELRREDNLIFERDGLLGDGRE